MRPTRNSRGAGHTPAAQPPSSLLGLAPGGGCLAAPVTRRAGGLLPHLFTLARTDAHASAVGGLFLWPYPRGYPLPGVTRRHALWSADFPRRLFSRRDHPAGLRLP